jgi:hypothetical protein
MKNESCHVLFSWDAGPWILRVCEPDGGKGTLVRRLLQLYIGFGDLEGMIYEVDLWQCAIFFLLWGKPRAILFSWGATQQTPHSKFTRKVSHVELH